MTETVKCSAGMNPKIKERIEQIHQGIVPEGYKKTKVGIIPEEWDVKKIKDVAPLQRGFDLPVSKVEEGDIPICYSNGIVRFHSEYKVKSPGVVTGRSGTIGKVFYIEKNFWPHNTTLWVTNFKGNHEKFIYYLYRGFKLERLLAGTGVPTLNRNDIHIQSVIVPVSRNEQEKIAEILSTWDRAIELKEALIKEKEEQKKGLMQYLLEESQFNQQEIKLKELVYEPKQTRVKEPWNIELLTVSLHNKGIKKSGKFPNKTQKGRPYYKRYKGELLIGRQNFHNGGFGFVLEEHDSLICSNAITSLLPREETNMYYVYYYLSNPNYYRRVESIIGGTGQKEISKKELMNLRIKAPSLKEQNKISNIMFTKDKQINFLKKELSLLKEQKKGLMQLLLTGIVRVGEVGKLE